MNRTQNQPSTSLLGKDTEYRADYAPDLLFPIPRDGNRSALGLTGKLPFYGIDIWNGYEISWLNHQGKPKVAVGRFCFPCDSPCIIESKSFKLYLNSLNQTRFESSVKLRDTLEYDLSKAVGTQVDVALEAVELYDDKTTNPFLHWVQENRFSCLDELDITVRTYKKDPNLLLPSTQTNENFAFYSHLLRSNCPVTGQPDWATVFICGEGQVPEAKALLAYLISYREQQDFHEHCVESIFMDLWHALSLDKLMVYARYTRRGGLDINPYRASYGDIPEWAAFNQKLSRQ